MTILAINPGSTSTKIAVYENEKPLMERNIKHSADELKKFATVIDQFEYRKEIILKELKTQGIPVQFDAVIGRGGLAKAIESGVYAVNDRMIEDMRSTPHQHACDLGCMLAHDIAEQIPGCPSYIADTGRVEELNEEARICGSPMFKRICIWHALNQRAIARRHARSIGKRYEDLNLIICHLGGGISVAAHDHGRAVDVNNSLDGEGPFSPERAGSLPVGDLIHLCFSGKYTEEELRARIAGNAGLKAHLGTHDMMEIEDRIANGDKHAELIVNAMIYHIAKEVASKGAVLYGKVDAIIFTGGIARSDYVIPRLRDRVAYLAPTYVYPGENELEALALNALAALRGECKVKEY